jgi:hypothetical protein
MVVGFGSETAGGLREDELLPGVSILILLHRVNSVVTHWQPFRLPSITPLG